MVVGKLWFQAITNLHMGVNWDSGPNQGLEKQCLGPAARPKCTIHQGEPSKAFWISKSAPNDILALHNGILYIYIYKYPAKDMSLPNSKRHFAMKELG